MRKRVALLLLLLMLLPTGGAFAAGNTGTGNYIYSYWGEQIPVPPAYTLQNSLTANELQGVSTLEGLADAYVTDDAVYVLCQKQLIVLDHAFRVKRVVTSYMQDGQEVAFEGNAGIFVTAEGDYYITQSDKGRILHFEADGTLRRVLERPDITGFENVNYRPTKLVVDSAGRIFVIAKGMYEGIVELNASGSFSRFYGVNKVPLNIVDLVWRAIATEAQRNRMALWLPTDFSNLTIDPDGFIFATVMGQEGKTVVRLNAKGENILKLPKNEVYPYGDLWTNMYGVGIPTGYSDLIAVTTNRYGMFMTLDSKRARVFAYNEDAKLLFILGGLGDREGYFRNPIDVDFVGDSILVLDQLAQSLEVFTPTAYGRALLKAVDAQHRFDYENAEGYWREALAYNPNLTLAYSGIGRSLLRAKRYDEALTYLRMGEDRKYYSKAFEKVRNERLREWFVPGVAGAAGLIVLVGGVKRIRRRGRPKDKGVGA